VSNIERFVPSADEVKTLSALVKSGQGLKAWERVQGFPPLGEWRGFEGRHIASRMAGVLGGGRLSGIIDYWNWKENRENDRAYFRALFVRLGLKASPLIMREMLERRAGISKDREEYCDLSGLIASCYGDVREYALGYEILDEAIPLSEEPSWLLVQRALLLRREDRYEESLEVVREARSVRRFYSPVETVLAEALVSLGRDDEAIESLFEASENSDNPAYPLKLSVMYSERDDVEKTSHWLNEYEGKSPLLSKQSRQWLAGRRADLAYLSGEMEQFLEFSSKTDEKSYHRKCAKYYQENKGELGERKRLDVRFVRQHSMTCGPATLSALSAYFGKEHDHLEIADAICYEGTPWHKERAWVEENGFVSREFEVTLESAKALIDAGIPFSLTTQGVTFAHLQACIGYDEKLGLLLLRDPTHRHYGEVIFQSLSDDHPVMGLRGMAFVPEEREKELNSLELPQTRVYDLYHEFLVALDRHDQERAEEVVRAFVREVPEEPLRFHVESRWASYKSHPATDFEKTEILGERFPKDQSLWLRKLRLLNQLSRHADARKFLAEIRSREERHPIFDTEQGELLCDDIRTIDLGDFYLRRALRHQSGEGRVYAAYARCLHILRRNEEALPFRRAASRLNRSFEPYALRYFSLAKTVRKEDEAQRFLEERAEDVGDQDVEPHLTLLDVLVSRDDPKAPEMAEDLLKRFPKSGELLLKTVSLFSGWNRSEESRQHLAEAEGRVPKRDWLRVAAKLTARLGDRMASHQYWRELARLNPLSVEAHEAIARHLAEEENRDAAIGYLRESLDESPDYIPLLKTYVDWLEKEGPGSAIAVLQRIVEMDSEDLWARRELAMEYSRDEQHELAKKCAQEALDRDPKDWDSQGVMGWVKAGAEDRLGAKVCFREALMLSIDHVSAFRGLMEQCENFEERKAALKFVRDEMVRQVSSGDVVPEYRERATGVIPLGDLQNDLELFHSERPDLWETWATLREHYSLNDQEERGLEVAIGFTERFPLVPRAWVELGFANRSLGQTEEEIAAFQHAIDLSPSWDWVLRELSQSLEESGRFEEALKVLERAVQASPLVPGGYGRKANLLWKIGEREEALATLRRGLMVAPYYGWGWSQLVEWSKICACSESVSSLLAELQKGREKYWRWWEQVADIYGEQGNDVEALGALDEGLKVSPKENRLLDQKASVLTRLGRFSEARAACRELNEPGPQPFNLRGREAWILMQEGKGEQAWDQMKAISDEEPDYYFGHSQLASWAYNVDAWPELKKAAQRMIALRPEESETWGYLGVAHEKLKELDEAHRAFTRALRIDPAYLFAARHKAEIEVNRRDFEAAAMTLAHIKHHDGTSFVVGDEIELLLKRTTGELPAEMADLWEELAWRSIEQEEDPYLYTDSIFEKENRLADYGLLLFERACSGHLASTAEARAWGRQVLTSKRRKKLIKETLGFPLSDELKASFLGALIRDEKSKAKYREKLISQNQSLLAAHVDSWRAVLDFHVGNRREKEACRWGDHWRRFEDELKAVNLVGYAACVDEVYDLGRGQVLRQEILSAYPQRRGSEFLRICLAFQDAAAGRLDAAEEWLAGAGNKDEVSPFYKTILLQAQAMIAAHQGNKVKAQSLFGRAASEMKEFAGDKASQKYLRSSAEVIARTLKVFRGNPKKLIKKWGWNILKDEGKGFSIWWIFLIAWIAIKIMQCSSS